MNRADHMRMLKRIVSTTLLQMRQRLQGSIDVSRALTKKLDEKSPLYRLASANSSASSRKKPALANTLASSRKTAKPEFQHDLDALVTKVKLLIIRPSGGDLCLNDRLCDIVNEFVTDNSNPKMASFKSNALNNQPGALEPYNRKFARTRLPAALKAVDPANKGNFQNMKIECMNEDNTSENKIRWSLSAQSAAMRTTLIFSPWWIELRELSSSVRTR
jgi:hypothetical protein